MLKSIDTRTLVRTTLLTIALSCGAFALAVGHLEYYGVTVFCVIPVVIGIVLGQRPTFKISLYFGVTIGILIFLLSLITAGWESLFCVITSLPLVLLFVYIGLWLGFFLRKQFSRPNNTLNTYLMPLALVLASAGIETTFTEKYNFTSIENSILLPYSPEVVFDHIKSVDSLGGETPFLFYIGIQKPLKCILKGDSVGASRTCYFEQGTIDERVTEFKRGESLKMRVTNLAMPGREWLHFRDAIYLFKKIGNDTKVTRITSYDTELKPRFYWRYFERLAIETEHEYVLNDLKRRLDDSRDKSIVAP
jgi:hypothetical protein